MKKKLAADAGSPAIPIREIRGERVLLDSDLAAIYGVSTKVLNQAVKRNSNRFPRDFFFQLQPGELVILRSQIVTAKSQNTEIQWDATLRSQNVTSNVQGQSSEEVVSLIAQNAISKRRRGGRVTLPYAFTEHGALQAANILKSERAAAMSVFVIRAFVQMRAELSKTSILAAKLADLEQRLTGRLDTQEHAIVQVMQQLVTLLSPPRLAPVPPKPKIGFKP